jgi:superfamily II DNA or RNA helicase
VLCLVATIEQGKQIANVSSGQLLHSGTKKRRQIIDDFRAGKIKALICTSLADEGLDVPISSVLVMACGGRSSGKTEQRTGRVLRPHSGKESGIVVDFTDSHHPMLAAQSWARKKTYSKLNYKITK